MQSAVRNYWKNLDISGEAAASCFHPDGYFHAIGKEKLVKGPALVKFLGSGKGVCASIQEIFWSFSEDTRSCTVEINVGGKYPLCDVFKFAFDSDLFMSMHVYGPL